MRLTFRAKLMTTVGAAALAFILLILVSSLISGRVTRQLADIEGRLIPKLALGPELDGQYERLGRSLQDAVAAQDPDALAATERLRDRMLATLDSAHDSVDAEDAAALRAAIDDYYQAAHDVSKRLLARETGEGLVDAMTALQAKHSRTAELLKKTTRLDRKELAAGFAATSRAQETGTKLFFAIGVVCLFSVLALSVAISRSLLRSLGDFSAGLARFGRGDFSRPLPVTRDDELGKLARDANQMAENLGRFAEQRDRSDWLKAGQARLTHELRGELELREVAARAIRLVASYLEAPAGALYLASGEGWLEPLGQYALAGEGAAGGAAPVFRPGEGLVGQAALQEEIVVVEDPPAGYVRVRSGLGEASPRTIVLAPLTHLGKVTGVIELALFKPCTALMRELLGSIRETLSIALEVARARAAARALLAETQRQAQRLAAQEEELSVNNEELQAQQEELKQANEELEEQRRALEEQNAELEGARRREQQKADTLATVSEYKSQFLANMSHELRTPLNSMLLLSNLLAQNESRNLTDKQVEFCGTIHAAGKDLLGLINQVLDLAKIEAGKQEVRPEIVSLRELVQRVEKIFAPLAADKGLRLSVDLDPALPASITTDRQRVEQILTNLVGNAIKFTRRGGVSLRLRRPQAGTRFGRDDLSAERTVALAVTDTGIGIAPEQQERIFAPFQQLDSRIDRRYGGSGLGLTIARELAGLLGGELQLASVAGEGSTFTCYLPERTSGVPAPAPALASPPGGVRGSSRAVTDDRAQLAAGEAHLMIIEDDPLFAEQLSALIHARNFKVVVASSGQEGLRLAKERRPMGIILDVMLPDIDGWTVMERLRFDPDTNAIPVHFVSSLDAPERGLAMGAVGYLTKPATQRELAGVVETLAPLAAERSRQILVVEDDAARGESLVRLLADEGFEAKHVTSGNAALAALKEGRFGCLVLDLGLADMDGLGFLELIEQQTDLEIPPVVVYTGRALTKAETRRIEAYAEAVVVKEGRSTERLLEEIRMFVQHLKEGLPRHRRPAPARRGLHPAGVRLEGKKILAVDDDMRTVYALSALLRSKGVEVLVADTGREALEIIAARPDIHGVLMDIMLPEMDGYEAMRRIRADARFAKLPIIALTARAMKGEREKCIEAGASDYLSKPIDGERLLALLQQWLETGERDGVGRRN
jgi:CheY-like chemotaxis protein